ncbi:ABC-type multidrug transport system [Furfurilactobacillus rossiae]|uniref:ABC transporter ATP-binding protein n=1 Tax=Furfurilactobacillus rossiae TaxID=231049 RepID=UPI0015BDC98A|nr:ABC transporter ATP-binding protein [Furfurilactobacillus rossiae]MCF6166313.1 ABC transporter ATP-binding protein/permease [Furfurilactobacillus rossiae]QLE65120.1 ABC-type multidrug transport system [Furfurilactobacillus rossiae]
MQINPKSFTIYQNIKWYLKKAKIKFPKLKYALPVNVLINVILLVATGSVPTLIVWALQKEFSFPFFSLMVLALCLGLGCLLWVSGTYKTWMTWENANLRMQLTVEDGAGFLTSPYEDSINTVLQKARRTSSKHGYEDDDTGVDVLWPSFVNFSATLASVITIILITLKITWWSPIVILFSALLTGIVSLMNNERQKKLKASLDDSNFIQNYLYQEAFKIDAAKDVRLYNLKKQYLEKIDETYQKVLTTQQKINFQKIKTVGIVCTLDFLQLVLVYVPLVIQASQHAISLPTFTFFFTVLGTLSATARKGATQFSQLILANSDVSIGREYLDYVDRLDSEQRSSQHIKLDGAINKIQLKNVSFHYSNDPKIILKNINLTIYKDETVALVGLNGAGKTTLVSLIMGLLIPTSGTILINDIDSKSVDMKSYRRCFAPVFQKGATFAESVKQNITMGYLSKKTVDEVITTAGLTNEVSDLKDGIDTGLTQYVDDSGVSLSGGQSQSLMLARALYKDAQVLILDEPTAALDALAESKLYERYYKITKNKISMFISHRLASTQFAKKVFFIKDGSLIASGTHSFLMQNNSEYAHLYNVQSKYYKEGDENVEE